MCPRRGVWDVEVGVVDVGWGGVGVWENRGGMGGGELIQLSHMQHKGTSKFLSTLSLCLASESLCFPRSSSPSTSC